jgi:hypothetical protein
VEVSTWNSLDAAKLIVSLLTPVFVLIFGIIINKSVKNAERATGLRSEIYKTTGGDLNDIYCYLFIVGCWKDLSPAEIISRKRAVDKAMYTYKPFFSQELFDTYHCFMIEAFKPFGGPGAGCKNPQRYIDASWRPARALLKDLGRCLETSVYEGMQRHGAASCV